MWNLNNFKYIKTMKNFNLFKSLLIMLCMVLMGGGSVKAETKTKSWDLTAVSSDWEASGNVEYFKQPYGFKKVNGTLANNSVEDFNVSGITEIKVGFKCLQNNSTTSKLTLYLIDSNSNIIGTGVEVTPVNANDKTKTTYQYATFTKNLEGATGFMMKVTTFEKNILVNGAEYVVTYTPDANYVSTPELSLAEGKYWKNQILEIGVPESAEGVRYTKDGSDPKISKTATTITASTQIDVTATTTIKAIAYNGANYSEEVSRTYTFVSSIANTKETAYTIPEAIAIIDSKSAEQLADEKVYVEGKVSKVDGIDDGSITYWLNNNTFKVYKGIKQKDVKFTDLSDIGLGANVIIYGNIIKYGSIYEFDSGNYLASYTASAATLQSVTIEGVSSVKQNYLEGESFDRTGLVAYANFSDGGKYDVTGNAGWTIKPSDALSVGTTKVSVSATYGGQSATSQINISVSPATTIDLSKANQVTTATNDKLEWTVEKFVVTAEKDKATTNTNNFYPGNSNTSTRFYKNSKLTFTPTAAIRIDKIVYTSTTTGYATAMAESTWTNATASVSGNTVTITPKNGLLPVSAKISDTTGGKDFKVACTDLTIANSRTTATGSYGTVCLPRDAKVVGAKIYDVTDANVNTVSITEVNGDVLEAGKPYIYKATADNQSFYCASGDDLMDAGTNGALVGSYAETSIGANNGNYILSGNAFHFVNSNNVKVGANRAYIHLDDAVSGGARLLIVEGDTETGICLPVVDAEEKAESTGVYDLSGRRVVNAKSGVYVQNGKLFIK